MIVIRVYVRGIVVRSGVHRADDTERGRHHPVRFRRLHRLEQGRDGAGLRSALVWPIILIIVGGVGGGAGGVLVVIGGVLGIAAEVSKEHTP